jgi:hypothetical protein
LNTISAASEASEAPSADDSSGPNAAYSDEEEGVEFFDAEEEFDLEVDGQLAAAAAGAAGVASLPTSSKLQQQQAVAVKARLV